MPAILMHLIDVYKRQELSNQKKESEASLNAAHSDFERQKETLQVQAALATEQAAVSYTHLPLNTVAIFFNGSIA